MPHRQYSLSSESLDGATSERPPPRARAAPAGSVVRSTQGETQSLPLVHAWGRARPLLRFPSGECGGGVSARATGSLAVPQLRAACTLQGPPQARGSGRRTGLISRRPAWSRTATSTLVLRPDSRTPRCNTLPSFLDKYGIELRMQRKCSA